MRFFATLRMTGSEGACNDDQARHEAKASHYETDHQPQLKALIDALCVPRTLYDAAKPSANLD